MVRLIGSSLMITVCLAAIPFGRAADTVSADHIQTTPQLIAQRSAERTGFQEAAPYDPRSDLRTDFVMAYGVDPSLADRLARWKEAGYVPHVMTGVSWGNYQDYLDGKTDGRKHWDESQADANGSPIMHGPTVPYMVPAVSFSKYLEDGVRRAIDAGAIAVHLEEPEFWARAGFSEAFQREWQIYYGEPWQRPDSSVDAQYRASKLKYYLYQRTLDRLCSSMKEYALAQHGRLVRFYVPTHSLLNYTQWSIVSPESSLLDLPGIDGYIAQVWTGTARTPNTYEGRTAERTFETAYLEYGIMQELVRGTSRRMWFLHDPIEDNPRHDWQDYRVNYIRTLIASLLQPHVWHYEVSPWPSRVFNGRYPHGSPQAQKIGADYATTLSVVFNQLRDMEQADIGRRRYCRRNRSVPRRLGHVPKGSARLQHRCDTRSERCHPANGRRSPSPQRLLRPHSAPIETRHSGPPRSTRQRGSLPGLSRRLPGPRSELRVHETDATGNAPCPGAMGAGKAARSSMWAPTPTLFTRHESGGTKPDSPIPTPANTCSRSLA